MLALLMLVGCGRSSFIGRQYDDLTAYYNKFYNARDAFEKGVESVRQDGRPVDRTRYLRLFPAPKETAGQSFEKAIQKSADVLRQHSETKWVDDALLLIGKSYYYQQNYVGAVQKFREVIDLESQKEGEARFWLARTLIANKQYEAAAEALRAGLASDREFGTWTARMHLARGALRVRQQQWTEAEAALRRGLNGPLPDRVAAEGAFLLGQVRQTLGDVEGARRAYRRVQDFDPRYELGFAARLSAIELQGLHGDAQSALARLRSLERDDKNYDMRGEMALVRARIRQAQGRPDAARRVLRGTLYGEEAPSGPSKGRLHHDLAQLYRDAYGDYESAAAHFDTASTTLSQDGESVRSLPGVPTEVQETAEQYARLAKRAEAVARLDSLLRLGRMSEEELQSFVAELRERRRARAQAQAEAAERASRSQQFSRQGAERARQRQASAPATQTRGSDAGFLFYKDPVRVQKGRRRFRDTWGNRPRVDNWRRRAAVQRAQSDTAAAEGSSSVASAAGAARRDGSSPRVDLSAVPRDSASRAKMQRKRAVAQYEFATALFLTAQRPDSAAALYRQILESRPDHPVADRARYALAEVRRAQNDTTEARALYREVIENNPGSALAARARRRLGTATTEGPTIEAQADTAYAQAYRAWQNGRPDTALVDMLSIAQRFPNAAAAPRALLASGVIYWRAVQQDTSAALQSLMRRHLSALARTDTLQASSSYRPGASRPPRDTSPGPEGPPPQSDTASVPATSPTSTADSASAAPALRVVRTPSVDTTRSIDTTRSAVDTTGTDPDSLRRGTLSGTASRPEADSTYPDSSRTPSPQRQSSRYALLDTLLTHLLERYPDTPQAKRARLIRQAVREQRRSLSDSTAVVTGSASAPPDSAAPTPDSTGVPPDSASTGRRVARARPVGPDSARGRPPTRSSNGPGAAADSSSSPSPSAPTVSSGRAWTLSLRPLPTRQEAKTKMRAVRRRLGRDSVQVRVLPDSSTAQPRYRVVVGRFPTRKATAEAQKQMARRLPMTLKPWRPGTAPDPR